MPPRQRAPDAGTGPEGGRPGALRRRPAAWRNPTARERLAAPSRAPENIGSVCEREPQDSGASSAGKEASNAPGITSGRTSMGSIRPDEYSVRGRLCECAPHGIPFGEKSGRNEPRERDGEVRLDISVWARMGGLAEMSEGSGGREWGCDYQSPTLLVAKDVRDTVYPRAHWPIL